MQFSYFQVQNNANMQILKIQTFLNKMYSLLLKFGWKNIKKRIWKTR